MLKKLGLTAAAALIASVTAASAQDFQNWGSNGGWQIWKSQSTGGCFMERETAEGIVMQIGSVKTMTGQGSDDNYGYLGLYLPGEQPASSGGDPLLVLETGPNRYIAKAHSQQRPGYWGGFIVSGTDTDLASDITNRKEMTGMTADGGGFKIDWTQSNVSQALKRLQTCATS